MVFQFRAQLSSLRWSPANQFNKTTPPSAVSLPMSHRSGTQPRQTIGLSRYISGWPFYLAPEPLDGLLRGRLQRKPDALAPRLYGFRV